MILIKHFNDIWKKMNKSFERFQIFGRENTEPNFFLLNMLHVWLYLYTIKERNLNLYYSCQ